LLPTYSLPKRRQAGTYTRYQAVGAGLPALNLAPWVGSIAATESPLPSELVLAHTLLNRLPAPNST